LSEPSALKFRTSRDKVIELTEYRWHCKHRLKYYNTNAGCHLFFNIDFPRLSHDQKNENPWPIGTTYISK